MKHPLKFWQKIYLATVAAFFACLVLILAAVPYLAQQQSYDARLEELLGTQRHMVRSLAQDMLSLYNSRSDALPELYQYYVAQYAAENCDYEIWQQGERVFSTLRHSIDTSRPELAAGPDQKIYLVRWYQGERYLFVGNGLSGTLEGTVVVGATSMESFFAQWAAARHRLYLMGAAVSVLFGAVLFIVLRRLNQPLKKLTDTAGLLAQGDFSARAPQTRRDEIGELGRIMNQMAAQTENQIAELESAVEEKQQLLDNLAHELRTPITAIGGWAQTIYTAPMDRDETMEAAQIIQFEAARLQSLSQRLLDISWMKHVQGEMEQVPLLPLVERVCLGLQTQAKQRQVELHLQCDACDTLRADPVLLESLLTNLLDNALKATPPGGRVTLRVRQDTKQVEFCVIDTGKGMDEETLRRLGTPFYRADKARSRSQGGTGLGMALCFAIARYHGAALHFDSAPGKGTRVTVVFSSDGDSLPEREQAAKG